VWHDSVPLAVWFDIRNIVAAEESPGPDGWNTGPFGRMI
jgi:hypothetical protein